ncbi:hypothetical protein HQ520_13545 [bacterium]|nr:hypothetical protein [bacterium]
MFLKSLQEQIHSTVDFAARHAEDLKRLEERLLALEKIREENFQAFATDGSNAVAHENLDRNDRDIAELKREIAAHKRRTRARLRTVRGRLLQNQESALRELQTLLKDRQDEQGEIRNVLLPEALHRLAVLKEKTANNEEAVREIQKEIERINHLDFDSML